MAVRDGHILETLQAPRLVEGELTDRMAALGGHIEALEWR
jgi:hypothetical protein